MNASFILATRTTALTAITDYGTVTMRSTTIPVHGRAGYNLAAREQKKVLGDASAGSSFNTAMPA
jgi:hypothetical protein